MGSGDIQKYLEPGVVAACENSERSTTLAGDADVVERVVSRIKEAQPSILARFLQVDEAYHSHHIVAVKDEVSAKKLFSSTVTGRQLTSDCVGRCRVLAKEARVASAFSLCWFRR